jgi:hypothetical protein
MNIDKKETKHTEKQEYTVIEPLVNATFLSRTPSGAAKKVYSKCVRNFDKDNKKSHIIKIKNKNGKVYEYEVYEISKNKNDNVVIRGDKEIYYSYTVIVKSNNIHKSEHKSELNKSKSKSSTPVHSYSPCKRPFVRIKKKPVENKTEP